MVLQQGFCRHPSTQTALNPSDAEIAIAASKIAETQATGAANKEKQALIQQKIEIDQQLDQDTKQLQQTDTD